MKQRIRNRQVTNYIRNTKRKKINTSIYLEREKEKKERQEERQVDQIYKEKEIHRDIKCEKEKKIDRYAGILDIQRERNEIHKEREEERYKEKEKKYIQTLNVRKERERV